MPATGIERGPLIELTRLGRGCLIFELGEGSRHNEETADLGATGLMNAMKVLGMIESGDPPPDRPPPVQRSSKVRCKTGGLLRCRVALAEEVEENQTIAVITSPFGAELEQINSPQNGFISRLSTLPAVWGGDEIADVTLLGSRR
jgi:predicted deacylase